MHTPDPKNTYIIGYSGGKDSTAAWLYLTRDLGLPNVTCTFADTGHEHPDTYAYLETLERDHGLPLVRIQPILEDFRGELKIEKIRDRLNVPEGMSDDDVWLQPLDMERLAILKRRFPSSMVRFCTIHLKLIPQKRYMAENYNLPDDSVIRVSGVRAAESKKRAGKPMWAFDELMGCHLWLPVHAWSWQQVFDIHKKYGVPPNPRYLAGASRVGCNPCLFARKPEIAALATREPENLVQLGKMENRVAAAVGKPAMSFFSNDKTPERFHSQTCQNTGKTFPTAADVARWATEDKEALAKLADRQGRLFDDDEPDEEEDIYACSSQYGLCE